MTDTVDVEACVRLLEEAKSLLADRARNRRRAAGEAEHSAEGFQWLALANQDDELVAVAGALASALPGMGKDSTTVAALTAENERLAKAINEAIGWLMALCERRQYDDDHEVCQLRDTLAAALPSSRETP